MRHAPTEPIAEAGRKGGFSIIQPPLDCERRCEIIGHEATVSSTPNKLMLDAVYVWCVAEMRVASGTFVGHADASYHI